MKENRRIDMGRRFNSYRRKSDRRSESFTVKPSFERSPIIVDDDGGVMAHVLTYPYIVPVYYNFGKYDLNKLNHDYHKTTTTTSTTENPWDRIDDIRLPDSFHENLHSVFSLKNYKQYVKEDEPRIKERYDKDENLVNHHISSYDIDEEKDNYLEEYYDYEANPNDYDNDDSDQHIKITRDYLKTYFNTLY